MENIPSYSGLDIRDFIKISLVALAKAQHTLSVEQTRAILETCFQYDEETKVHNPVMLTMALTRSFVTPSEGDDDSSYLQHHTGHFSIPLITLIPINALGLDVLNLDFAMEVTSQYTTEVEYVHTLTQEKETNKRVNLIGKIASNSNLDNMSLPTQRRNPQQQSGSNLKVHIEAHSIPLTKGLLSIIDVYTNAIKPHEYDTTPNPSQNTDTPSKS